MLRVIFVKKNSLNHIEKKGSTLWVSKKKKVQFVESYSTKDFNSSSLIRKRSAILSFILKKRFNSVSHIQKKVQFCESYSKKSSILWVIFHFLESYLKKGPILFVIFEQKVQYFASYQRNLTVQFIASYSRNKRFNSLRHTQEINQFFGDIQGKRVQFCESYSKKGSILWVILEKIQFFESC